MVREEYFRVEGIEDIELLGPFVAQPQEGDVIELYDDETKSGKLYLITQVIWEVSISWPGSPVSPKFVVERITGE